MVFFYGELIPFPTKVPGHSKLLEAPFSGTSQKTPRVVNRAPFGAWNGHGSWDFFNGIYRGFIGIP